MTDLFDRRLTRIELVVLARLSAPKALTRGEITNSLRTLSLPLNTSAGAGLNEYVDAALVTLRNHKFIMIVSTSESIKGKSRKSGAKPRHALTELGKHELRSAFGLDRTPLWAEVRDRVIPALGIGEPAAGEAADAALHNVDAMIATWLRRDRTLGSVTSVAHLCDQVIARALGMPPGPVTPAGIRAYALAKHCGVDNKAEFEHIAARFAPTKAPRSTKSRKADREIKRLKLVAAELAKRQLGPEFKAKDKALRSLLQHWVRQRDVADSALPRPTSKPVETNANDATSTTRPLHEGTSTLDSMLIAVQEAIPMVGSDGRYGKDNVFVSALWRQVACDGRLHDLSLDRFKTWLVDANRDQLVALARADLVDDMDARLVEASEIQDLGETFHFVIDRKETSPAPGQLRHAR